MPMVNAAGPGSEWQCSPRLELSSVWTFLARKYDSDGDEVVTAAEYDRGETRFINYDRTGDGQLTAADFPPDTYFNGFSHYLVRQADADEDETITRAEWDAFAARLDADGSGVITPDEAKRAMGEWADDWPLFLLSFDQDQDGDFDAFDLDVTFRDQDYDGDGALTGKETAGWAATAERPDTPPPAVGEAAPAIDLMFADGSGAFRLADAIREQPVALVFGSYT